MRKRRILSSGVPESLGAFGARADVTEVIVTIYSGGVAVVEAQLNGVVANDCGGLGAGLGLIHGKNRCGLEARSGFAKLRFVLARVIARGAGTFLTKVRKIVVAGVAVGPDDIHTRSRGDMNFDADGLFPRVERTRHFLDRRSGLGLAVAAVARRNGIAMRTCLRMAQECADPLVEFRADDVLELASLRLGFRIFD